MKKLLLVIAFAGFLLASDNSLAQTVQPFGVTNYVQGGLLYVVVLTTNTFSFSMESDMNGSGTFSSGGVSFFPTSVGGKPAFVTSATSTGDFRAVTTVSGVTSYSTNMAKVFMATVTLVGGNRQVTVRGATNRAYSVQVATSPGLTNWTTAIVGAVGQTNFVDAFPTGIRFYRVITP